MEGDLVGREQARRRARVADDEGRFAIDGRPWAPVQVAWRGGGPPVLILSLKAGGVGLNLTAANHVVHYDRWWNPAVEDQATDRVFRIGQQRNVQVRKFVCVGTVEERIDAMLESKRELAERIVGTGEARLTDLNLAQLRELVALSEDAVAEA